MALKPDAEDGGGPRCDATAPYRPQRIHVPLLLQLLQNIPTVLSQKKKKKRWEPPTARGEGLFRSLLRVQALQNRSRHWYETLKYTCYPPDGAAASDGGGKLLDVRLLKLLKYLIRQFFSYFLIIILY